MSGTYKIIIVPPFPVFNKEEVPAFENFSKEDSCLLYSTLYLNHKDIITKLEEDIEITYCFHEKDKDFLPSELNDENIKKYFLESDKAGASISKLLSKRITQENPNVLLLLSNSIGISLSCIRKSFNLLNYEDNNILLGKSANGRISFIGLNFFNEKIFNSLKSFNIEFDEILRHVNKHENHLHTLNGYLTIENFENFRELYRILSKKESIRFCSHEMHEQFTHLFIEYKEIL